MGDQLAGEHVDARVAFEGTIGEFWQLEVVLARKVLTDFADLILDDVMVVPQPVFGSDRWHVGARRLRQKPIRIVELFRTLVQSRNERTAAECSAREAVQPRQHHRVTFELVLAEEFWWSGPRFLDFRLGWRDQRRGHPPSLKERAITNL